MPQDTQQHNYQLEIAFPVLSDIRRMPNAELAVLMDPEIGKFEQWFTEQGNAGLTKIERAILKTYLAWKLLYEEGCPASVTP